MTCACCCCQACYLLTSSPSLLSCMSCLVSPSSSCCYSSSRSPVLCTSCCFQHLFFFPAGMCVGHCQMLICCRQSNIVLLLCLCLCPLLCLPPLYQNTANELPCNEYVVPSLHLSRATTWAPLQELLDSCRGQGGVQASARLPVCWYLGFLYMSLSKQALSGLTATALDLQAFVSLHTNLMPRLLPASARAC